MIILTDSFFDDDDGTDKAVLTQQHLIDTQERLGALLDMLPNMIPMGLLIHQPQAMLFVNNEICHLFSTSQQEMLGKHLLDFVTDDLREKLFPVFMKAFHGSDPINLTEIELQSPDGKVHFVNMSIGKLPWDGLNCVQIVLQDVTELILKERELTRLSMTDPLTGAFNRRYFLTQSKKAILDSQANNTHLSLIVFDLDWFKKINDDYGHDAGDLVLQSIVTLWEENSRQTNEATRRQNDSHLARIGGEEFAVVLPGENIEGAMAIANRIKRQIEELDIMFQDEIIKITGSFGVTSFIAGDDMDEMFRRADQALYTSKDNGRNQVTQA